MLLPSCFSYILFMIKRQQISFTESLHKITDQAKSLTENGDAVMHKLALQVTLLNNVKVMHFMAGNMPGECTDGS